MSRVATCPHCGAKNVVDNKSFSDVVENDIPAGLLKAAAVVVVGAFTGGIGAVLASGAILADAVSKYADGVVVTCGSCGSEFRFR